MRIELDRLKELGGRFAHIYQPADLLLDDKEARLVEPAEVQGTIQRSGNEVVLRGRLRATVELLCGRCLNQVALPVDAEFTERLTSAVSWRAEPLHELKEEDLNLSVFDGEAVELDEVVREEILLAIPGHVLCREACQGLCPNCGVDRNETSCHCETEKSDSPWQGLRRLQS